MTISEKIGAQHRARKAILYIRQSSAHQVQHNPESRALQYAMRDRLAQLGWSEIETIDEDPGLSAAGGTARAGFERMVAAVGAKTAYIEPGSPWEKSYARIWVTAD